MSEAVVIEYQDGPLKGAQYQIASAELAAKVHPDAKVVSYFDGRPFEAAPAPVAAPTTAVAHPVASTTPTAAASHAAPAVPAGTV